MMHRDDGNASNLYQSEQSFRTELLRSSFIKRQILLISSIEQVVDLRPHCTHPNQRDISSPSKTTAALAQPTQRPHRYLANHTLSKSCTVAVAAPSPGMTFCAQLLAKQETAQGGTSLTTLNLSLPTA